MTDATDLKEAIARIIDAEAMQVDAVTGTGKPFSGSVRESSALAKAIAILDLFADRSNLLQTDLDETAAAILRSLGRDREGSVTVTDMARVTTILANFAYTKVRS